MTTVNKDNKPLRKWSIENRHSFPKEHLKTIYDINQNVLFGAEYIKGIIKYNYIPKEYTITNNDIYVSSSCEYNGIGCDLSDKETIEYINLPKRFPDNYKK